MTSLSFDLRGLIKVNMIILPMPLKELLPIKSKKEVTLVLFLAKKQDKKQKDGVYTHDLEMVQETKSKVLIRCFSPDFNLKYIPRSK